MHRLPSIAPQSIWLNGAPNCPPCEIWSTVSPFTTSGLMTVSTWMHDWSEVFGYNVPPPVTRQVTGEIQFTEAMHVLGAVITGLPLTSKTQGTVALLVAVPCTVTVKLVPFGQLTSTLQAGRVKSLPAATKTLAGSGLPLISV